MSKLPEWRISEILHDLCGRLRGMAISQRRSSSFGTGRRALLCALALAQWVSAAQAAAGPLVWQDPMTGLALGGYDPLAYHTRGEASTGRGAYELRWGGAVWRFVNSGNREAFERHPEVYAPRFAGYDPYSIASGTTTPGLPTIWARAGDAVYLFHSAANRRLWLENREALLELADRNWQELSQTLPSSLGQ